MPTEKVDYAARVREIVPDLEYKAEFVPQSASRNAGEKEPSLNWRVTFKRNRITLSRDYFQGIGHVPGRPQSYVRKLAYEFDKDQHAAQTGRGRWYQASDGVHQFQKDPKIPAPEAADVLHSLLLDAEAIDAGTFEDWAEDHGYDTDSRKAEAIYKACLDIGLALRRMLGDDKITALREALEGM